MLRFLYQHGGRLNLPRVSAICAASASATATATAAFCFWPGQPCASCSVDAVGYSRLAGKVALITGAGSGIGEAIALEFARHGATVVVNDLPPNEADPLDNGGVDRAAKVAAAARSIQRAARDGAETLVCHADVSDRAAVKEMYDVVLRKFGRLDIVVSNAYYSKRQPLLEQDFAEFSKTIEVTQHGAYHVCQLGAKAMVACRSTKQAELAGGGRAGKIIVITSVNAPHPYLLPGSTSYNMAKAALGEWHRCHTASSCRSHAPPQLVFYFCRGNGAEHGQRACVPRDQRQCDTAGLDPYTGRATVHDRC